MKKALLLLLCAGMLLCFFGCNNQETWEKPVRFYYLGTDFSYDAQCTAIQSETREGAEFATLEDTLAAYLKGPNSGNLTSPFPAGLRLISVRQEENTLHVTVTRHLANLSGLNLTIACCCIAKTCMELTDAENITIQAEDALLGSERTITLNAENMILLDNVQQPKN